MKYWIKLLKEKQFITFTKDTSIDYYLVFLRVLQVLIVLSAISVPFVIEYLK